jgi:adenylate cyclase
LSLELGKLVSAREGSVKYRFISDYPFIGRGSHDLDPFEHEALKDLRKDPDTPIVQVSGSIWDRSVRVASPVLMGEACVRCHNTHPESPKMDWKVGDVRGIQEISVSQPLGANLFVFKYLMLYFAFAALAGFTFIGMQRRQEALVPQHRDFDRSLGGPSS